MTTPQNLTHRWFTRHDAKPVPIVDCGDFRWLMLLWRRPICKLFRHDFRDQQASVDWKATLQQTRIRQSAQAASVTGTPEGEEFTFRRINDFSRRDAQPFHNMAVCLIEALSASW